MSPEIPKSGAGILVVDDVSSNLHLLTGMLKDCGYKVRPVPSGKLALQAAQHDPPDLILLDVLMPEMNGYEVCERLKANEKLAGIPVVFISALTEQLDKARAFAVGGVDYLTKPVQMEELQARVETHLKLRRLQVELEQANAQLQTTNTALKDALAYAEGVVDTVREPLLVLGGDLRVRTANRSFYQMFRVTPAETEGQLVYHLGERQWDIPHLRKLLEEILPRHTSFDDFEVEHDFGTVGRKVMLLNARRVLEESKQADLILLAIEDVTERRRAEEERREIETRFTSLVKTIRDYSIFTTDLDGRITSWNEAAERVLGFSEAEILDRNFSVIFTPEDRQRGAPEQERRRAMEVGSADEERWHLRKNGERFWAFGVVTPTYDASGNHTGFSKVLRDMTLRKKAEEELQRAYEQAETRVRERTAELTAVNEGLKKEIGQRLLVERRLSAQNTATKALAESPNLEAAIPRILEAVCTSLDWAWAAVWLVDPLKNSLKLVNFWHGPLTGLDEFHTACQEETFTPSEGFLGRVWTAAEPIWAPDLMLDKNFSRRQAAARCGLHGFFGIPILRGREVLGVVEFFSQRIEHPDRELMAMLTGISSQIGRFIEKEQAEIALEKEQEFLKAVLENAQDGIVACDAQGTLAFFNRAARKFHGKVEQRIPAEKWPTEFDLYQADGKSLLAMEEVPLFRALRGERVRDEVIVIHPEGGEARTMLVSGQTIADGAGKPLGAVVVMHDITERNLLEAQFHQAQKMEAFGQLAGGVAHDFNNLLTVISGYSEILLEILPPTDPNREMIREILKAGGRAALLTRQLLAFSRKQIIQPQVLDLNAVVASTEKMLERLIGEDMNLTTILAPGLGRVNADPGQIEQVIMNLVLNARDAMPQGGRITIETANVDLCGESHAEVEPGRYVLLAVSDAGSGMTEEVQQRIFEPFFTTKEVGKGTGLGLSTVFGIVKQSGGNIKIQSELGRGSTFKIYLPSVAEDIPASQAPSDLAPVLTGTETILLVEDEKALRAMAGFALKANGYTLLEAADGEEAIRLCERRSEPIHLLVSDVVMPRMGGRQLAEKLTALHPEMRVLFVSGYTDDAVVRHGVLQAEVAFLQKPFTMDALHRKVRAVLDGPG